MGGLPLLSTLNALPLLGFLTFSRKSQTKEQWAFRHSLWHYFLAIDMPFFMVFGAYSGATDAGEARPDSEASSDSEREAKPRAPLANAAVSTGLICAVVLIIGLISLVLRERRLRGTAFLAKNLMEGFDNDCYQVGMYYADPVRLPNLFRSLQPDAEACQGECAISIGLLADWE
eukprot:g31476.t1